MQHPEDRLQMACVRVFALQWPDMALLLHHSPNEGLLPRTARDGAKRKAMGVRAGFPDLVLLVPGGRWHYLCMELKSPAGRLSSSQRDYQRAVERAGGCYAVIRDLPDFLRTVRAYLHGGRDPLTGDFPLDGEPEPREGTTARKNVITNKNNNNP